MNCPGIIIIELTNFEMTGSIIIMELRNFERTYLAVICKGFRGRNLSDSKFSS